MHFTCSRCGQIQQTFEDSWDHLFTHKENRLNVGQCQKEAYRLVCSQVWPLADYSVRPANSAKAMDISEVY